MLPMRVGEGGSDVVENGVAYTIVKNLITVAYVGIKGASR